MLLPTAPAHIIYSFEHTGVDVTIVLCRRLATDVGRCRDYRLLESVAQFLREGFLRNADAYRAVLGYEVGCQIDGSVKYQGRRTVTAVDYLPRHVGHIADIALQAGIAVDQTD